MDECNLCKHIIINSTKQHNVIDFFVHLWPIIDKISFIMIIVLDACLNIMFFSKQRRFAGSFIIYGCQKYVIFKLIYSM